MNMRLHKYKSKRDFAKTKEPLGKIVKSSKKRIFVIQHHFSKREHYDFRLEWRGVLLSWAIPKGLASNPKDKRLAIRVEDHPYDYKDFEGEIPEGEYGAGIVEIYDQGLWEPLTPINNGLKEGMIKFELFGSKVKGKYALVRMDEKNWLIIKEKESMIKNKTTINNIKYTNPFSSFSVELALLSEEIPSENGWLYEIKYDGYRIVTIIEKNKIKMLTRNKQDYTDKFASISKELLEFSNSRVMILDGEVIKCDDNGKSDFSALQESIKHKRNDLTYVVFDLIALDGKDLRGYELIKRKKLLKSLFNKHKKLNSIVYSEHIEGDGKVFFEKAEKLNLEGIIGKKKDSQYLGRRSGNWIKLKCRKSDEYYIVGYNLSMVEKEKIKSLLLAQYENGALKYRGKVGTGIKNHQDLLKKFKALAVKKPSFISTTKIDKNVIFLKPSLFAEIEFAELTSSGLLRQASYKGIRYDKDLKNLAKDNIIEITSPDRIVYPKLKITKQNIVDYYRMVSEKMLPLISNRPLSVYRCHENITLGYIKKHPEKKIAGIKIFNIKEENNKKEYFAITSLNGLINEVQNGTIEFHVWANFYNKLTKPNYMVFDLDPDEGLSINTIRQGVKDLKKILDDFNLKSFLKTSGGKGYHVVVPLSCNSWSKFSSFAKDVALLMENKYPDRYTTNNKKSARKGKIFVDWLRNKKGATSVAPYSLRAKENASVSAPISWNELNKIAPDDITYFNIESRLKKDPWRGFEKTLENQNLK